MATILQRQRLTAELSSLRAALETARAGDVLGRLGLESRIAQLEEELGELARLPGTKAEVALVFNGRPVNGSSSIQASFGTKALDAFQRAVSTSFALNAARGHIGQRGPAPASELSSLHITGVTHGSFGFVLEEVDPDRTQWLDSSLKVASEEVVTLVERIASADEAEAATAIEEVNERLFGNVRDLIKTIAEGDATLQVALPDRVADLGYEPLRRAYERIAHASIEDSEVSLRGVLEGILPAARRFEFRSDGQLIKGKVARDISEEYLQSLQIAPLVGRSATASFRKRIVHDYLSAPRESYVLVRISPDDGLPSHLA
ncbi:hypothetical protein [Phenylobacterium sp. RIFCSPHIGHO2_01_FULL_69_31]|uniref:hypothetical protein n=1 Tax=Phenylobacterium sp. RIFCSPHIGHO2_01_FULL_69_31 TaxID=1801944 RepID=UPI000A5DFD27|nr:hypothetical protein [Phenylobacterium sp. RIFCSPHIGHO2_01_FULL_69_31]